MMIYKGDKWTKIYGSKIPIGASVYVMKYCYRRRVLVEYNGEIVLTLLWCIKK
jgi:hypothetical protein